VATSIQVFLPDSTGQLRPDLPRPPQRRSDPRLRYRASITAPPALQLGFELLIGRYQGIIAHIERPRSFPAPAIAAGAILMGLIGFLLWSRERRIRVQRKKLRKTYQLERRFLGAPSAADVLKRLSDALPAILGITASNSNVYNRAAKTLDAIASEHGEAASISLSSPPGGTPAGAVACFHYRTLLVIPDIDRSPFPSPGIRTSIRPRASSLSR